jgi:hypothetical protein
VHLSSKAAKHNWRVQCGRIENKRRRRRGRKRK